MPGLGTLPEGRLFLSPAEVASLLDADPRTVRKAVQEGKIPGFKLGVYWKIPAAWVLEQAGIRGDAA